MILNWVMWLNSRSPEANQTQTIAGCAGQVSEPVVTKVAFSVCLRGPWLPPAAETKGDSGDYNKDCDVSKMIRDYNQSRMDYNWSSLLRSVDGAREGGAEVRLHVDNLSNSGSFRPLHKEENPWRISLTALWCHWCNSEEPAEGLWGDQHHQHHHYH